MAWAKIAETLEPYNFLRKIYGFDTFEGLPEKWGAFSAGDMESGIPKTDDSRCAFIKGLFQMEVFIKFLAEK